MVIAARPVGAGRLGTEIPSNCVAHVSFDDGVDFVDDYRCAGLAIEFHTAGVAFSPGPIWAGQWLFVDEAGQFRVGSCTFNRGIHPTIDVPSTLVAQTFPNDPTGARVAYLTWRYGDTTDNLTAAAMWAVLHYYAHDGAGTRRAWTGAAPLVAFPRHDRSRPVGAMTSRRWRLPSTPKRPEMRSSGRSSSASMSPGTSRSR